MKGRLKDPQTFRFVKTLDTGTLLATSAAVPTFAGLKFKLSDLAEVSSFLTLFDQYRIPLVEVWVNPSQAIATSDKGAHLVSVIDLDDASALTSIAQATDYESACMTTVAQGHYRSFVPHVAVAAYSGAFTSFANEAAPWIDAASSGVEHYGLKLACDTTSGGSQNILGFARYHVEFRKNR
jgi:hypothetical protein